MKFSCPHCEQHIEVDSSLAVTQIACPSCQQNFTVELSQGDIARETAASNEVAKRTTDGCPSCGVALPRGTVICTNCGLNKATGKKMVKGRLRQPDDQGVDLKWYRTAYPYIGAVLVILGILALLGRSNRDLASEAAFLLLIYLLVVRIILIREAYEWGLFHAFLIFVFPSYIIFLFFHTRALWPLILWISTWVAIIEVAVLCGFK